MAVRTDKLFVFDPRDETHYSNYDTERRCGFDDSKRAFATPYFDDKTRKLTCPASAPAQPQWWRALRIHQYNCPNGKCDNSNIGVGGDDCRENVDCDKRHEHGVCDLETKACTRGSKHSDPCLRHEDCDTHTPVKGTCDLSIRACITGKTGVEATHLLPQTCTPPRTDLENAPPTYCGAIRVGDETKYTGKCEPFRLPGQTEDSWGCRAFASAVEVEQEQWNHHSILNGLKHSNYNPEGKMEYMRLAACPAEHTRVIGDQTVCMPTKELLPASTETVMGTPRADAVRARTEALCGNRHGPCPLEYAFISSK